MKAENTLLCGLKGGKQNIGSKMGDRYYLEVICPYCNHKQKELVWYAPTCGFITHECEKCKKIIDLEKYSGIDAESCANTIYGIKAVKELKKKLKKGTVLE